MIRSFLFGAAAYPLIEIVWRGRTHYSMALAGGLSMVLIKGVSRMPGKTAVKVLLCGAGITGIEYACGMLWNRDWHIWDYRKTPLNVKGQICLSYSLVWCGLSGAVLLFLRKQR